MKNLFFMFLLILSFVWVGCSTKESDYNKPADYWYESMLNEIRFDNLEGADDRFASLQSEHINSPLIKEAMLILGHAHLKEREYILAGFYFDEYMKRYGDARSIPFAAYMKLKANYYSFGRENINQQLLLETIQETEEYSRKYAFLPYHYAARTLLVNLYLAQDELNQEIMRIYRMRDAENAVVFYDQQRLEWVRNIPKSPARIPWYQIPFNW